MDNGETWTAPQKFIDSGGIDLNLDPQNLNEVYLDCPRLFPPHNGIPERFAFGWTKSGGGPNATIHNHYHKDAHFAYFYPGEDTITNVHGDDLGDMIDYNEIEMCIVYDSGPLDPDNKHIVDYYFAPSLTNETGYPIMIYNVNRTLMSSRYDGTRWVHSSVVDGSLPRANNNFDLESIGPQSFRLYYADGNLKIFDSHDGGVTWKKPQQYSPGNAGKITKVQKIPDAHPELQLVATENTMCANGFEECTQDYRGLSNVWTLGKGEFNAETPLVDVSSRYIISMKGIEEIRNEEIRIWERSVENWFLYFYHRGEAWREPRWQSWYYKKFRPRVSIYNLDEEQIAFFNDPRRLDTFKRDSRDVQSTFSFIKQSVSYDKDGIPTNEILYDYSNKL